MDDLNTEAPEFDIDSAVDSIGSDLGFGEASAPEPLEAAKPETAPSSVDTTPAADPEKASTIQPDENAPPRSWAKETHELWAQLPPAAQAQIVRREKDFLDGIEQYKGDATYGRSLREVFTPHKDMYQGASEPQVFQFLLNANRMLTQGSVEERRAAYEKLGQNLGITPADPNAPVIPPEVKALKDEIAQIKSGLTEQQQREHQQQAEKIGRDVNAFADAKDEKGNPLHPYFDEVSDEIVSLIAAERQRGRQPDLAKIYETAVRMNPVTYAKEQARALEAHEAKLRENARLDALKARKASGANVRSRDTSKAPTEPLGTMDDTMRATLADIKSRTH